MPRLQVPNPPLAMLATIVALLTLPALASARSWMIPHVLEVSGTTQNTQYTFDTQIFATYTPGLGGGGVTNSATMNVYLYDGTGQPMRSGTAQVVCNPCVYALGAGGARKVSLTVDDLIMAAGGFGGSVKTGYAIVVVGGADPDGVDLQGFINNSHTSAFDLSVFGFEPQPILAEGAAARTYSFPHVFETAGRTTNTQYSFDTSMYITYGGGQAGLPNNGGSAQVDLYLYDNAGVPWTGPIGAVCNPCSYQMSGAVRKRVLSLEDLVIGNGGGFGGANAKTGFALVAVSGDVDNVALQGFVVNAHTSAFDLSVFGYSPEEVKSASNVAVFEADRVGAAVELRSSPNPSQGEMQFSYSLSRPADVKLEVFDAAGRRVATVLSERRAAGPGTVRWNRRDESGNALASGIYYGRLAAGDGSRITKLVFLPD